ncbi:MAG: FtsX-like permease family protein [Verrucomicrobiaceae bacterium]|nr:FtsX-like permease family protein [Verrucomicrobiaceae bacterium]
MLCAVSDPTDNRRRRPSGWHRLIGETRESLSMALDSVVSHKLRSGLTLLGIMIGVFSIIVVMTVLRVLDTNAQESLSQLGPHTFRVKRTPPFFFSSSKERRKVSAREPIDWRQCRELIRRAELPISIGVEEGLTNGTVRSEFAETNPDISLRGVTPEVFPARVWDLEDGRAIQPADVDSARLVCVLSNGLAKKLFPRSQAVGDRITFDGLAYRVIGVLEKKGQMGVNEDSFVAVPISTGLQRYSNPWVSLGLVVQTAGEELYESTVEEVRGIMRVLRRTPLGEDDDFEIVSNDSLMEQFREVTFAVRAGVGVISSIALLAAGIGIMNIMLISVTERTKEIGVRRAIGARKRMILTQFIVEAVILCLLGGIVGVVLGVSAGNILSFVFKTPAVVPFDWVAYGLGICTLVGVAFGAYPAFKAANIDPIDALRYE